MGEQLKLFNSQEALQQETSTAGGSGRSGKHTKVTLYPSDWFYNAGVVGLLQLLEETGLNVEDWFTDDGGVEIDLESVVSKLESIAYRYVQKAIKVNIKKTKNIKESINKLEQDIKDKLEQDIKDFLINGIKNIKIDNKKRSKHSGLEDILILNKEKEKINSVILNEFKEPKVKVERKSDFIYISVNSELSLEVEVYNKKDKKSRKENIKCSFIGAINLEQIVGLCITDKGRFYILLEDEIKNNLKNIIENHFKSPKAGSMFIQLTGKEGPYITNLMSGYNINSFFKNYIVTILSLVEEKPECFICGKWKAEKKYTSTISHLLANSYGEFSNAYWDMEESKAPQICNLCYFILIHKQIGGVKKGNDYFFINTPDFRLTYKLNKLAKKLADTEKLSSILAKSIMELNTYFLSTIGTWASMNIEIVHINTGKKKADHFILPDVVVRLLADNSVRKILKSIDSPKILDMVINLDIEGLVTLAQMLMHDLGEGWDNKSFEKNEKRKKYYKEKYGLNFDSKDKKNKQGTDSIDIFKKILELCSIMVRYKHEHHSGGGYV